jgi:RND family efflux transporter MFP subunit
LWNWLLRSLPWIVFAGALLILFLLFGKRLLPSTAVEVETVVTVREASGEPAGTGSALTKAGADPFAGAVLFQASGWFEADPYPHRATALVSGVVEAVHVLEGQSVNKGDPIASLISEDAGLRLEKARASLEAAGAALDAARSAHDLSHARVESMRRDIDVAQARREELEDLAVRAIELGPEVLSQEHIIQSKLRLNTQKQTIAALEAQLKERQIEAERLGRQLRVQEGLLSEAEVRLREAELEFERTIIRAPVDGIVQRLSVAPGQKKVLMADNPESATVALLFHPKELQARIDVPISEASRLSVGQAVLVASEYLPGRELRGHIQRIVGEADLQRNTLQVKVRIMDPPPGLRPEILCRAQFLDTAIPGMAARASQIAEAPVSAADSGRLRILVPDSALFDRNGDQASVWAVDSSGARIALRRVTLTGEDREGYKVLREGLRPGDRVVLRPSTDLDDGTRIRF